MRSLISILRHKLSWLGPPQKLLKSGRALHDQGYAAVLLPVSAAFHTSLIAFAQKSFAIATKSVGFPNSQNSGFQQRHRQALSQRTPRQFKKSWKAHLSNSVLFKQEIENIYAAGGYLLCGIWAEANSYQLSERYPRRSPPHHRMLSTPAPKRIAIALCEKQLCSYA